MMNARLLFNVSAVAEALVGFALLIVPADVIRLLLGGGLSQTGTAVARLLGVGLLSLGISAWETESRKIRRPPRVGICTYNLGAAALLLTLGTLGTSSGILLWPAVALHGSIGAAMVWVMMIPVGDGVR